MSYLNNDYIVNRPISELPKLVIFDMDGLIFDSERLFMKHLIKIANEYGYTITKEMYVNTLGLAGENLRKKMNEYCGPDYPLREIGEKSRVSMKEEIMTDGLPVKPGIRDLLEYLKNKEIPVAVASSSPKRHVTEYLEITGLLNYFRLVIGGESVANSKPAPDIFFKVADELHMPFNKCMVLEDSENGIRAAYNARMIPVCIPDLKYPCDDVAGLADIILNDANELIDILEKLD